MIDLFPYRPKVKPKFLEGLYNLNNAWANVRRQHDKKRLPQLAAYWPFWEGSGDKTYDLSGYENHGTLKNSPVWNLGEKGVVLDLDGTNDYVEVPNSDSLEFGTSDFTISAWIYRESSDASHMIVDKRNTADGGDGYLMGVHRFNIVHIYLKVGVATAEIASLSTINNNKWYFIAGVFDRDANGRIYINGTLDNSGSISATSGSISNGGRLAIGDHSPDITSSWGCFNGLIGGVRMYNEALTDQHIGFFYSEPFFDLYSISPPKYFFVSAPPAGLSIPVAMHHYKQQGMN